MDDEFDLMIRERMNEALRVALREHDLSKLVLSPESARVRFQRRLGEMLILVGMHLRDSVPASARSTARSGG